MSAIHETRLETLRKVMRDQQVDCVAICNSPNLFYMTDYSPKKDERFQVVFVPQQGEPVLALPKLYESGASVCTVKDHRVWVDGVDMIAFVKEILDGMGVTNGRIAIDDTFEYRTLRMIRLAAPRAEFVPGSNLFTVLRMRKSPEEIELMRKSGELSDWAIGQVADRIMEGKSEAELKTWIEYELSQKGMRQGFSNIIAFGVNSCNGHHASNDTIAKMGDAIILDLGGAYEHYWSDITRSFHVGKPDDLYLEVYQRVREAQQLGFEAIKPGVRACDVHMLVWDYLEKYDLAKYWTTRLGHGEGLDGHELPNLAKDCDIILEPGMTFSCEPNIAIPGKFGIRIEDTVCVTETGAVSFNHFTKDLIIL